MLGSKHTASFSIMEKKVSRGNHQFPRNGFVIISYYQKSIITVINDSKRA